MAYRKTLIFGVAGGSGSGKSTFARALQAELGESVSMILSQDHYYIDQSDRFKEDGGEVNFDHPSALDFPLLAQHLDLLCLGKVAPIPIYDFASHRRLKETTPLAPNSVLLLDGTMILWSQEVRSRLHGSVFLSVPEQLRFERRLVRDVRERGRTEEGVRKQFFRQVKPMHDQFVDSSQTYATWVRTEDTPLEIDLVKCVEWIKKNISSL
jgi:uridine kinase